MPPTTARARARAELTREIVAAARGQVAETGAATLSLRAVAREVGMVSSAVYRYFPSRDDLLTTLIVESYEALARALDGADSGGQPGQRWRERTGALRAWALAHPHEYALLYGTPVPGYAAPERTIGPAAAVFMALAAPLAARPGTGELPEPLAGQLAAVRASGATDLDDATLLEMFQALGTLFGSLNLELFGHFVGSMDPAQAFWERTVQDLAGRLGLAG